VIWRQLRGQTAVPKSSFLQTRLEEQRETLAESGNDAETIRRVAEEARFIRQDIARVAKKHRGANVTAAVRQNDGCL